MKHLRRIALTVLGLACLVYLGAGCWMYSNQRSLIYPIAHDPENARLPRAKDIAGEWLEHDIGQGSVDYVFLPSTLTTTETPAPLVVICHGNGSLVDQYIPYAQFWTSRGFHVLIPEYRGYGRSAGSPTQREITDDIVAMIEAVQARPEVHDRHVIMRGHSLGGAISASVIRRVKPRAWVVSSTFTSMDDIARARFMPPFVVLDHFRTSEVFASADFPILLTHGESDETIAFHHGESLSKTNTRVEFHTFECGHNGCPERSVHEKLMYEFLNKHDLLPAEKRTP